MLTVLVFLCPVLCQVQGMGMPTDHGAWAMLEGLETRGGKQSERCTWPG